MSSRLSLRCNKTRAVFPVVDVPPLPVESGMSQACQVASKIFFSSLSLADTRNLLVWLVFDSDQSNTPADIWTPIFMTKSNERSNEALEQTEFHLLELVHWSVQSLFHSLFWTSAHYHHLTQDPGRCE